MNIIESLIWLTIFIYSYLTIGFINTLIVIFFGFLISGLFIILFAVGMALAAYYRGDD